MAKWNPRTARRNEPMAKIKDVEDDVKNLQTQNSTRQTTISKGALTVNKGAGIEVADGGDILVKGGGNLLIRDGGGVRLSQSGSFMSLYDDNWRASTFIGGFDVGDTPYSGIVCQHPEGADYFNAWRENSSGRTRTRINCDAVFINGVDALRQSVDSSAALWIENTGTGGIYLNSSTNQVWISHNSSGGGTQCGITEAGLIYRITSSERYKQDIEDHTDQVDDVLKLRPRKWRDKNAVEEFGEQAPTHVGFIAEELVDIGLDAYVIRNEAGDPESIAYDRLSAALIQVVKSQDARLAAIEERLAELGNEEPVEPVEPLRAALTAQHIETRPVPCVKPLEPREPK